jgi:hypothetical protein
MNADPGGSAMEVYDPSGATEVTVAFAKRLDTLEGKKIGLLSNGMWRADQALALLKDRFQERYPTSTLVHIPARERIQSEEVIEAIAREGYDAVVVGNAA